MKSKIYGGGNMTEQEILESLCNHIMVTDTDNPLDNPFFEHCYNICIENKDKMTDGTIWEIVDREDTILFWKERKFINELRKYYR